MQRPAFRLAALTALVACALFSSLVATSAAPKAEEKAKSENKPAKAAAEDGPKTRLPNYFGQVLDDAQKAKVTAVQSEFAPQIAQKRAELKALNEKQDAAIQKVVSTEQWQQIDKLRSEARAKRLGRVAAGGGKGKAKSTKTKSEK